MIGGGAAALGAILYGTKKATETTDAIEEGVNAPPVSLPLTLPVPLPEEVSNKLPTFTARLTGYWPYQEGLSAEERKMEGGTKDRAGKPVITLEQHQRDPIKYPYVTVAGDYNIFPLGQRLIISAWPSALFRVTDTGGHFFGPKKVYRMIGAEPLDIAVNSSKTPVPKTGIKVQIVPGDTFAKKGLLEVATGKLKDQTILFTGDMREGRTTADKEALARALESELGGRPKEELIAAAWTMRNRADKKGTSLSQLLAPQGKYGSPAVSKGYASTRRPPTEKSRATASEVLDAVSGDPTNGATDFWVPSQQEKLRQLGDIYRAAVKSGDIEKAVKYARYAKYGTEGDVRVKHAQKGLRVTHVIGVLECLRKV